MRRLSLMLIVAVVTGCQITDKKPESFIASDAKPGASKFILLGAGQYEGELTLALMENGFRVKPIAVTQDVTELEGSTRLVEYKEAGYEYGLKIDITHDRSWGCAFSGAHRVSATMSVVNLKSNETLAIVKQVAPDGSCHLSPQYGRYLLTNSLKSGILEMTNRGLPRYWGSK